MASWMRAGIGLERRSVVVPGQARPPNPPAEMVCSVFVSLSFPVTPAAEYGSLLSQGRQQLPGEIPTPHLFTPRHFPFGSKRFMVPARFALGEINS
jgi:hypothetical protein